MTWLLLRYCGGSGDDKMHVGIGYDVHPLTEGRKLILGGVEIPFGRGPGGWSDADVLTHAVIDSLLGATALGDIGSHFPPGKPEFKDISSMVLLGKIRTKLVENGWQVVNIDATVIAESPRLSTYIDQMRKQLSKILGIDVSQVSVKASTSNGLGFIGNSEGIAACAVALIESVK